jgi:hypothetical protein
MSLILDGTNGLSDVDGTAATPAIRGTDTNTGIFFPAVDTIAFSEGGTEAMRIDSAGNVTLQKNISVGGATPTTSGAGITFPATQSASTDANTLDDYEEGTFTPTITTDGAPVTTYTTQTGKYTKIGNVVYFQIGIVWSAFTGTGNVTIGGFPFPVPIVDPSKTISMPVISSTTAGLANYSLSDFRTSGSFTALYLYSFTGAATSIATAGSSGTITIKSFYFV